MMALIMNVFPGMTRDWLLWECSFQEFFLWNDRAVETKTGKSSTRGDMITAEEIKSLFVWDDDKQRWK